MDDLFIRFYSNLFGRLHGPLTLRLLMQPAMAIFMATRDGLRDARGDRPAYLWALWTRSGDRQNLLRESWKTLARTIAIGGVTDAIYQLIELGWIYPLELVTVVLTLVCVPYVLWRGPMSRIARHWTMRKA